MATGPYPPRMAIPITTDRAFRTIVGATITESMCGVQASVGADTTWRLEWDLPWGALPSGTLKLLLRLRTAATGGNCKVNPKWNCGASGTDIDAMTMITPAANAYKQIETSITLVASTALHSNTLYMNLVFETASWTCASITGWSPLLYWT